MSFVADQVRRLDARVDRLCLSPLSSVGASHHVGEELSEDETADLAALSSRRVSDLLRISKALSATSSSQSLLGSSKIRNLLRQSGLASQPLSEGPSLATKNHYESEIEWLIVGKATIQTYGLILNTLLDQVIPLSDEIWYWDGVLGSYAYSSLYTVQTYPLRLWSRAVATWDDARARFRHRYFSATGGPAPESPAVPLSEQWCRFYSVVRESVMQRSIGDLQQRLVSPVALCRSQARRKQKQLRWLRVMVSAGLGVLIDEGLSFDGSEDDSRSESPDATQEWKGMLERSVALMDMVLQCVLELGDGITAFEDKVFAGVDKDPELSVHMEDLDTAGRPAVLARRLLGLLDVAIPGHVAATKDIVSQCGRPPRLVRYWLPAGLLVVSSTTILGFLVNRKADIVDWMQNFGATTRDFWFNWVIEPLRKIVGTIRHDPGSEIAIMSRESLQADRESLERMVVDFALDNPDLAVGEPRLSDAQVVEIRTRVKEGDVTPVLRAYERDLQSPFVGAVRGELVRTLLIQVQKTKVDLEVAISGIDSLLKSQELVFGFVGLTPGAVVLVAALRYLRTLSGSRKDMRRGQRAVRVIRVLRNIDRILSEASPSQNNFLSYKDHGLLVCEVHVLRRLARGLLPDDVEKEFIEDLDDLGKLRGIPIQVRAFERIRSSYSRWLG